MKNKSRATLKDVAKEAGVNFTLVSKYLNHNAQARMTKETRARIDLALKKLNYRPSASARTLRIGKSRAIGLLSGDLTNNYRAHFANAAFGELGKMGYQLLLALNEGNREEEAMQSLISRDVDGVIFLGPGKPVWTNLPCPMIVNDRRVPAYSEVNLDIAEALDKALENVSGKVVGLYFDESPWGEDIKRAADRKKLECQCECLPFDPDERLKKLRLICVKRPEAVIVNGWHTVEMLEELLDSENSGYSPKIFMHSNCRGKFLDDPRIAGVIYSSGTDMIRQTCEILVDIIEGKIAGPVKRNLATKFIAAKTPEFENLRSAHFKLT